MEFWKNYSHQYPLGLDPTDPESFAQGYSAHAGRANEGGSSGSEISPSRGMASGASSELSGLQHERGRSGAEADASRQPRTPDVLSRLRSLTLSSPSDYRGRVDRTLAPVIQSYSVEVPDQRQDQEAYWGHEYASASYGMSSPGTILDHQVLWQSMPHPEGQIEPNMHGYMGVPPWLAQTTPQPMYDAAAYLSCPQPLYSPAESSQRGAAPGGLQGRARHALQAKASPYYSAKLGRQSTVNHNEKAYFPGEEGSEDGLIVCRHLAMAWLLQHETAGKPNYHALGDLDSIAHNVPRWVEDVYKRVLAHSADVHIVDNSDWRSFAAERFRELERSGADSKRMLIESGVHTMAAEFKIKRAPGMPAQYVQKFYDPSRTATHKRASAGDVDGIQPESITEFLSGQQAHDNYFGESEKVFLAVGVPPMGAFGLPPEPPGGLDNRRLAGRLPALDGTVVHHLLANGFGGSLRDIQAEIEGIADLSEDEAADLLTASNLEGDSGLFTAAGKGLADVIHAYCDLVRRCGLDLDVHAELLAGRSADEAPALFAAMNQGFGDASRALIQGIVGSGLEPEAQANLLAARNGGVSALTSALSCGRAHAVAAFVQGVAASGLSHREVFKLLKGSNANGAPPSLALAMAGDKDLAIGAFVDAVLAADVPHKMKLKVLQGEWQGHSALRFAIARGCDRSAAAYCEAIQRSPLAFEDKAYLLDTAAPSHLRAT